MRVNTICVLGGTGFVGRHVLSRLVAAGYRLRVLTRRRERHRDLLVLPTVQLVEANVHDREVLVRELTGCQAAINLVGILNDPSRDGAAMHRVHVELPRKLVDACQTAGVRRLLHMSALNADADQGPSIYLRTKGEGENLVHEAESLGMRVTSFRPSVIFGTEDSFVNRFASLLRMAPGVLPLACPDSRFAPVHVGDVAHCFAAAVTDPATFGQRYELCGPRSYTLHQIVKYIATVMDLRRWVLDLGDRMSYWQALILQRLPGQLFTVDNYLSLKVPSVCEGPFPAVFGIAPTALEVVVPSYLGPLTQRARYHALRSQARRTMEVPLAMDERGKA